MVHRDVKPDNVLLERGTERAMLVDFGIARVHHPRAAAGAGEAAGGRALTGGLTRVGEVVGTPQFMSPEQATGDAVDPQSDLYSFGATAYCALAGRAPFDGPTTTAIIAMQLTQPPPDLAAARPELPAPLDRLPLLAPAGAILPMTASPDSARLHDEPSRLLRLFPGPGHGSSRFVLVEDDGLTEGGPATRLTCGLSWAPEQVHLRLDASGAFPLPDAISYALPPGERRPVRVERGAGVPTLTALR